MNSITKKQASLALVVVALAAIMIAGTIAASSDSAFATQKVKNKQAIKQGCKSNQRSLVSSSSLIGASLSANVPIDLCLNLNSGSNTADNSFNH